MAAIVAGVLTAIMHDAANRAKVAELEITLATNIASYEQRSEHHREVLVQKGEELAKKQLEVEAKQREVETKEGELELARNAAQLEIDRIQRELTQTKIVELRGWAVESLLGIRSEVFAARRSWQVIFPGEETLRRPSEQLLDSETDALQASFNREKEYWAQHQKKIKKSEVAFRSSTALFEHLLGGSLEILAAQFKQIVDTWNRGVSARLDSLDQAIGLLSDAKKAKTVAVGNLLPLSSKLSFASYLVANFLYETPTDELPVATRAEREIYRNCRELSEVAKSSTSAIGAENYQQYWKISEAIVKAKSSANFAIHLISVTELLLEDLQGMTVSDLIKQKPPETIFSEGDYANTAARLEQSLKRAMART